jgi:tRNA pseudouridine55 synthase
MDGVLTIDKPAGMTSHDVVSRVRRVLKTKKVGHTGTLDPFATGVLVLLVGKATRLAQFIDRASKEYVAEIRFGFETDTGDLTGKPLGDEQSCDLSIAEIEDVLRRFRGDIAQIPHMYSAKKVDGRKLYELAREGETIERKPCVVTIYELELLEAYLEKEKKIRIRVACSAGTYIRTLAEDIGKALNTGAHLTNLRRTSVGQFRIATAIELDAFEKMQEPSKSLINWDRLLSHLRHLDLPQNRVKATMNGLPTHVDRNDLADGDPVSILEPNGNIVAIGFYDASDRCVRPRIVLV